MAQRDQQTIYCSGCPRYGNEGYDQTELGEWHVLGHMCWQMNPCHYLICPNLSFPASHSAVSKDFRVVSKNIQSELTPVNGLSSSFAEAPPAVLMHESEVWIHYQRTTLTCPPLAHIQSSSRCPSHDQSMNQSNPEFSPPQTTFRGDSTFRRWRLFP